MKKKLALSTRCFIGLCVLELIFVITTIMWFYHMTTGNIVLNFNPFVMLGLLWLVNIGVVIFISDFVMRPYIQIKNLYKMFLEQQIYEELFDSKYVLAPKFEQVMQRFHHLLDKQVAINMSKKQAEYLALQNQINPHFLYNTLEAIRGDALGEGMINIAETTEALATFFRYTVTEVENLVTLEDEINNVENYFIIQQYRFGAKLNMEIKLPDDDHVLSLQLPKLTLQPIIENAIFHGLESKAKGGKVMIMIETTQSKLLIGIVDDGVGMDREILDKVNERLSRVAISYVSDDKKKRGGIALNNVSRRIKLLFGEEYGIHIFSIVNFGTDVRITLPLIRGN